MENANGEGEAVEADGHDYSQSHVKKVQNLKALAMQLARSNTSMFDNMNLIEQQLWKLPLFHIPDHPPYANMIQTAILESKEEDGSSEEAISMFIKEKYKDLPIAHETQLSVRLAKLVEKGEVVLNSENCYMFPTFESTESSSKSRKNQSKRCRKKRDGSLDKRNVNTGSKGQAGSDQACENEVERLSMNQAEEDTTADEPETEMIKDGNPICEERIIRSAEHKIMRKKQKKVTRERCETKLKRKHIKQGHKNLVSKRNKLELQKEECKQSEAMQTQQQNGLDVRREAIEVENKEEEKHERIEEEQKCSSGSRLLVEMHSNEQEREEILENNLLQVFEQRNEGSKDKNRLLELQDEAFDEFSKAIDKFSRKHELDETVLASPTSLRSEEVDMYCSVPPPRDKCVNLLAKLHKLQGDVIKMMGSSTEMNDLNHTNLYSGGASTDIVLYDQKQQTRLPNLKRAPEVELEQKQTKEYDEATNSQLKKTKAAEKTREKLETRGTASLENSPEVSQRDSEQPGKDHCIECHATQMEENESSPQKLKQKKQPVKLLQPLNLVSSESDTVSTIVNSDLGLNIASVQTQKCMLQLMISESPELVESPEKGKPEERVTCHDQRKKLPYQPETRKSSFDACSVVLCLQAPVSSKRLECSVVNTQHRLKKRQLQPIDQSVSQTEISVDNTTAEPFYSQKLLEQPQRSRPRGRAKALKPNSDVPTAVGESNSIEHQQLYRGLVSNEKDNIGVPMEVEFLSGHQNDIEQRPRKRGQRRPLKLKSKVATDIGELISVDQEQKLSQLSPNQKAGVDASMDVALSSDDQNKIEEKKSRKRNREKLLKLNHDIATATGKSLSVHQKQQQQQQLSQRQDLSPNQKGNVDIPMEIEFSLGCQSNGEKQPRKHGRGRPRKLTSDVDTTIGESISIAHQQQLGHSPSNQKGTIDDPLELSDSSDHENPKEQQTKIRVRLPKRKLNLDSPTEVAHQTNMQKETRQEGGVRPPILIKPETDTSQVSFLKSQNPLQVEEKQPLDEELKPATKANAKKLLSLQGQQNSLPTQGSGIERLTRSKAAAAAAATEASGYLQKQQDKHLGQRRLTRASAAASDASKVKFLK